MPAFNACPTIQRTLHQKECSTRPAKCLNPTRTPGGTLQKAAEGRGSRGHGTYKKFPKLLPKPNPNHLTLCYIAYMLDIDQTVNIIFSAIDGPQSICMYTSFDEAAADEAEDEPALYIDITTKESFTHLGPFNPAIRQQVEEVLGICSACGGCGDGEDCDCCGDLCNECMEKAEAESEKQES